MKRSTLTALICVLLIAFSALLSGCGAQNDPLCGVWAYNHDPETPVLTVNKNGKAVFDGETYAYESDSDFIYLTNDGETLTMRYELEKDGMNLYEMTVYTFEGDGTPDGLVGRWVNDQGWDFEFTAQGTFIEDGYFPGYYTVDEDAQTFKLIYNDHFFDTVCYYAIEGNTLRVEYPWPMVKAE